MLSRRVIFLAVLLLSIIFVISFCVSCVWSVPCSLVVIRWERDDLLALLRLMSSCVFVTFPNGVLDQCGTWLYRFLIFAFFLTFKCMIKPLRTLCWLYSNFIMSLRSDVCSFWCHILVCLFKLTFWGKRTFDCITPHEQSCLNHTVK